ncbi:MAG: hypothetical protein II455_02895 [Paludibacteraceae bacterium]|nr:hypothetical protein [Paludibacteraceae bacterium]
MDLKELRNRTIFNEYVRRLKEGDCRRSPRLLIRQIVNNEAPQYYISFERAARLLCLYEENRQHLIKSDTLREQIGELYKKYRMIKDSDVYNVYTKSQILETILQTRATSYFVNYKTMINIIFRMLKKK